LRPFFVAVLWLASLAFGESAFADPTPPTPPTVTVAGYASEEARPDIARVTLEILTQHPSAADAEGEGARVATAVIEGLKASGIEAKDITTVGLSLFPIWSEERDPKSGQTIKRTLTGYQASNTLNVRVRTIDKAGALIAQAVQNGATYQGLAFDLSDREAREDVLRVKAASNALHRASLYAQGVGAKLGPIQSIGEDGGQSVFRSGALPAPKSFALASGATAMPIEPGFVSLSAGVTASWSLVPQ